MTFILTTNKAYAKSVVCCLTNRRLLYLFLLVITASAPPSAIILFGTHHGMNYKECNGVRCVVTTGFVTCKSTS